MTPDWRKACFEWYDEVRKPGLQPGMNPTKWTGGTYLGVGHFTQLIWATTEHVGCGYMVYNHPSVRNHDTQYYVCNYGPAGNYNGRPVYRGGAPCSACPSGTSCTERGLCARSMSSIVIMALIFTVHVFRGGSETKPTTTTARPMTSEATTEDYDDYTFTIPPYRPPFVSTQSPATETPGIDYDEHILITFLQWLWNFYPFYRVGSV